MVKHADTYTMPPVLTDFIDSFAHHQLASDEESDCVIAVDETFPERYVNAFNTYARPDFIARVQQPGGRYFDDGEIADLLGNVSYVLAVRLARLSFEMIASHVASRGASISPDVLHQYLEIVERWNVVITEYSGSQVDEYLRELNQRLAVLEAHYGEMRDKKAAKMVRRYRWPYVFSAASQ